MASRDRPKRQEKKKPKDAGKKAPLIQPMLEPPTNVEVWKPKRKPRTEEPES
ncbi:MAG: hypothetical protein ABSD62_13050 [Candidatus Limnocylindrales bacterium]|jgi:hypothetical protein